LEEFKLILDDVTIPVKASWCEFLETSLEPAGYSAIWRLSRATCEDLNIKFPCEVFGFVNETDFSELTATVEIISVQDENVHLPENCEVPLEDLYPTVEQENNALNVDLTADCLDRYRFFFQKIYMPWDHDDSAANFITKLLLPRMKLFYDLKNKLISKGLSSHIRGMIAEIKYIQNKREHLELSFDESEDIDISRGESKDTARKLLELHLSMNRIKHEIDILVNPEMRAIYEELKFPHHQLGKNEEGGKTIFGVTKAGTLSEQLQMIQEMKHKVSDDEKIHWLSLHDSIAASVPSSEIYIPNGAHTMNFLEYLNGDILLCGLSTISMETLDMEQVQRYAKISAVDSGSMLFAVDGDLKLENLMIDCENVKTGFLVKGGKLTVKNCVIYGSKDSSITEGFTLSGDAKVLIENCVIMNFATAITVSDAAKVNIRNSTIKNCNTGVHLLNDDSMVSLENSSLLNCNEYGILKYTKLPADVKSKSLDWNDKTETGS
jgi:Right handed beta helix region